jgi:hypothetical protein
MSTRWNRFKRIAREDTISYHIEEKMVDIKKLLFDQGFHLSLRYYPLNSLGYIDDFQFNFLKGALLLLAQIEASTYIVIEYLVELDDYILSESKINIRFNHLSNNEGYCEEQDLNIVFDQILEYRKILFTTSEAKEMCTAFSQLFHKV